MTFHSSEEACRTPIRHDIDHIRHCLASRDRPAFLESGRGFGEQGRWSFLAAEPRLILRADGDRLSARWSDGREERSGGDPLEWLGGWLDRLGLNDRARGGVDEDSPPFQGGLIGFLGYDLAPHIERLPRARPLDSRMPDLWFGLYDHWIAHPLATGRSVAMRANLLGENVAEFDERTASFLRALAERPDARRPSRVSAFGALIAPEDYRRSVRRAIDYIGAGDVFQVNVAQRFEAVGDFDPLDLHERLSRRSPAPFAALIGTESGWVISSSPELFQETRGDRIVTRPIKGTRPRGQGEAADGRLREELEQSPKDRAELAMIVDLERNDLGRVCRYGTVRVVEPGAIESFAQVHHRVATIEGRLREEVRPVEVVRALFPGGSITGAPKIRAMEIIDELEACRRGVYTGSIGYFTPGGSAFNIAIRTMVLEGRRLTFHAGGGIVADSDPRAEYEETLHKARGMLEVVEGRA